MLAIIDAVKAVAPASLVRCIKQAGFVQRIYDRAIVTQNFRRKLGRRPNLRNPTTFNEKVAYKMLYDRRPLLTLIADKVKVRDYVAERVGAQFLPKVYGIFESVDEIDWQQLPESFVIKANHGCEMNVFVPDKAKANTAEIALQLRVWLGRNFYYHLREWCYLDIRPMVLIEELLRDEHSDHLIDWKFFVFDGRCKCVRVCLGPSEDRRQNYYDRDLRRMNVRMGHVPNSPNDPIMPTNIETMFSVAETLGRGLDFVRVDLYNVKGRIVVGELTNYPGAGLRQFIPAEFDALLGREWQVPAQY